MHSKPKPVRAFFPDLERPAGREDGFFNPFNHRRWLDVFDRTLPFFERLRFLAPPALLAPLPDRVERLYVTQELHEQPAEPADAEEASGIDVGTALDEDRRVVVLGEAGTGKSTLVGHLVTQLAGRRKSLLSERLGNLIPIPLMLREIAIERETRLDQVLIELVEQPRWEGKLQQRNLREVLESGQGLFLVDGLDEVTGTDRRRAVLRVVRESIERYPKSRWLMTSSPEAYESVNGKVGAGSSSLDGLRCYRLAPLSERQIHRLIDNWYQHLEPDETLRQRVTTGLKSALTSSAALRRLARNPQDLGHLIWIRWAMASTPSSRSRLYDRRLELYLESLATAGSGLEVLDWQRRLWLEELAFRMQAERAREGPAPYGRLVDRREAQAVITRALGPGASAEEELHLLCHPHGLLAAEGAGRYAFVHSTFQEYLAACYLYHRLTSLDARGGQLERLPELAQSPAWHGVVRLLTGKLAMHPGSTERLLELLFFEAASSQPALRLAATLIDGEDSGLSAEGRQRLGRWLDSQRLGSRS